VACLPVPRASIFFLFSSFCLVAYAVFISFHKIYLKATLRHGTYLNRTFLYTTARTSPRRVAIVES
jgi:hypothetical protein